MIINIIIIPIKLLNLNTYTHINTRIHTYTHTHIYLHAQTLTCPHLTYYAPTQNYTHITRTHPHTHTPTHSHTHTRTHPHLHTSLHTDLFKYIQQNHQHTFPTILHSPTHILLTTHHNSPLHPPNKGVKTPYPRAQGRPLQQCLPPPTKKRANDLFLNEISVSTRLCSFCRWFVWWRCR